MTDHLEPYRRMARSIRFFPPLSLEQPPQESVALTGTPALGSSSTRKTIADDYEISALEPPIDPSEHIAALVHEAVSRPTVLPTTYAIQENIGDRISRLATPKRPKPVTPSAIEFKIPQPVPEYNGKLAHTIAPEPSKEEINQQEAKLGASTTVREVAELPTVTEAAKEALEEDTNQQLEDIQPEPSVTVVAEAPTVPEIAEPETPEEDTNQQLEDIQPEPSVTVVAEAPTVETLEPEALEEDTNQQLEDIQSESPGTVAAEAPTVETPEPEALEEDTNQQLEDIQPEPSAAVVAEAPTVETPEPEALEEDTKKQIDDNHLEASATVSTAAPSVTQTPSDEPGEVVVEPSEIEKTSDEEALSEGVVEPVAAELTIDEDAVVTAVQQPEVETEPNPTPAAAIKVPAADTVEPLKTDVAAETSKAAPASLSEPVAVETKDTDAEKKPADGVLEAVPEVQEQVTDTKTDEMTCPQCESTNLKKNGRRGGKQRYACKDCGKQFVTEIEEESNQKDTSRVEPAKSKDSEVEAQRSDSSKRSSKKKTKAKGFGNSKVK